MQAASERAARPEAANKRCRVMAEVSQTLL
jgi:hypothetical protein